MRWREATRRQLLRWGTIGLAAGTAGYLTPERSNESNRVTSKATGPATNVTDQLPLQATAPPVRWRAAYGRSAGFPYDVIRTDDGGFAFIGGGFSTDADVVVVKTEPGPEPEIDWKVPLSPNVGSLSLNATIYGNAFSISEAGDGYVCSGPFADLFLFEIDESGSLAWQETYPEVTTDAEFSYIYGGEAEVIGTGMIASSDGGYLLTGLGGVLVKTDAEGSRVWKRLLTPELGGKQAPLLLSSGVQTSDGGYAISEMGPLVDPPEGESSTYWPGIVTVDGSGDRQWRRQYRDSLQSALGFELSAALPTAIAQTTDGGFALTGGVGGQDGQSETFVVRTDGDGRVAWIKTSPYPQTRGRLSAHGWTDVLPASDGGMLLLGRFSKSQTRLRKLDSTGDEQWTQSLANTLGTTAARTDDGGVVTAGFVAVDNESGPGLAKVGGSSATGESDASAEFDPQLHAFGFDNWSGKSGFRSQTSGSKSYQPHDHGQVSRNEVRTLIEENWVPKIDERADGGFDPGTAWLKAATRILYVQINRATLTNGHCYGMAFTSRDYFKQPETIPVEAQTAADIEAPTDPQDSDSEPVADDIDTYQQSQALEFSYWLQCTALKRGREPDYGAVLEQIRTDLEERGVAGVGLFDPATNSLHQTLAYEQEEKEQKNEVNDVRIYLYDPNWPATHYTSEKHRTKRSIRFRRSENGVKPPIYPTPGPTYNRPFYITGDREIEPVTFYYRGYGALLNRLAKGIIAFLPMSPIRIEVTGPDGDPVTGLGAQRGRRGPTAYENALYRVGAPAGEYTVRVSGEESGEYGLHVVGEKRDGATIDTRVQDTIEQGDAHEYVVSVPAEEGTTGSISRAPTDTPADTARTKTERERTTKEDSAPATTGASGPGFTTLAGLLGGTGTLAARWLRAENDDRDS